MSFLGRRGVSSAGLLGTAAGEIVTEMRR